MALDLMGASIIPSRCS